MRVYVVAAPLGSARKAILQRGDDVLVAYDPHNGGSLTAARNIAAEINARWTKEQAAAIVRLQSHAVASR